MEQRWTGVVWKAEMTDDSHDFGGKHKYKHTDYRETRSIDSIVGRSVVTHSMLVSIATQVDDVCNDYYWMSGFFLFEIMIMSL